MVVTVCTRLVSHIILEHIVHYVHSCALYALRALENHIVKSAHKCMFYFDVHFCALCAHCAFSALKDT